MVKRDKVFEKWIKEPTEANKKDFVKMINKVYTKVLLSIYENPRERERESRTSKS